MTQPEQGISWNSLCGSSSKFCLTIKSEILPFHRIDRKIKTKSEYINLAIFRRTVDALYNFEVLSRGALKNENDTISMFIVGGQWSF